MGFYVGEGVGVGLAVGFTVGVADGFGLGVGVVCSAVGVGETYTIFPPPLGISIDRPLPGDGLGVLVGFGVAEGFGVFVGLGVVVGCEEGDSTGGGVPSGSTGSPSGCGV